MTTEPTYDLAQAAKDDNYARFIQLGGDRDHWDHLRQAYGTKTKINYGRRGIA